MGLEITVFYPFHPLRGRTLAVLSKARNAVTVLDPNERGLKIAVWMTNPHASGYVVEENAKIDVAALLSLSRLLIDTGVSSHATLLLPEGTPVAGGDDETIGVGICR